MKQFLFKPYSWAIIFSVLLTGATTYVLLDTFVIPKSIVKVIVDTTVNTEADTDAPSTEDSESAQILTDTSYQDDNIKINITTEKADDTTVYIADISITDISYLKTALANDTYGRNIKEATSEIAENNQAIFAINGDFYGFRDYGYVLRNGTLYRDTAGAAEDLVIDNTGDFSILDESETSTDSLNLSSIWQILSFGPALVKEGNVVVDNTSEVSRSMSSNPRTAIGMISPLHYVIIVSDGRTEESTGLSLLELADLFTKQGCIEAYNLDGGGSSTMYFNGKVVNIPTDGRTFGEREVSDIVYIGY
jgi:exopolysaccharide biosynthesis protein